jgi:hypothetical protein
MPGILAPAVGSFPQGQWKTFVPSVLCTSRSLSEKEPVYQSIVAVSRVQGAHDSSLLWSLLSRRHAEALDERALQEHVSALGAPALPAGGSSPQRQAVRRR